MTHDQAQPFNEDAALAELERLRQAIMAARRERQQKSDEFDAFVQGFRKPLPVPPPVEPQEPLPRRPSVPVETVPPAVVASPPSDELPAVAPPSDTSPVAEIASPVAAKASARRALRVRWPIAVGATVGVIALGVFATRSRNQAPPIEPVNPITDSPRAAAPEPADTSPAPAAQEPAPAAQPISRAVTLELKTLQSVWMRVVVDGEKKSEGMVPGGESLHFGADESIVIRVGNGGAVVIKSGDRETPFGAADQPVTRKFSKQ